jgi:phenylalanyl-tRNA synthetase beta chain
MSLLVFPHPDADRLKITTVDLGDGVPVQIVCGLMNAKRPVNDWHHII